MKIKMMMKIFVYMFCFYSIVFANNQIEKVHIDITKPITIPLIEDKALQEFSYSTKDTKLKPFYIAKYETTLSQYNQYLKSVGQTAKIVVDEEALSEPVTNIDFDSAKKVCRFYGGRLPTQLEWVVSASIKVAPSKHYEHILKNSFVPYPTATYPLQTEDKHIQSMMKDDDEIEADLIGSELLEVFESYENINGTYGMLGNVWEWVEDEVIYFNKKYRIIKGGSYANFGQNKLYDSRVSNFVNPDTKMLNIGFRCVWDK